VCRAEAAELYRPLFEKGLSDEADLVREAAVDGLLYINRAEALANLRGGFVNDRSITIRKKLIDAAGEVGGEEDLVWLVDKIGVNGEGEPAWQSILKILRRSGTGVLANWVARLESETLRDRLSGEQKLAFLEIAEQKAAGENNTVMLSSVSRALADIYKERGDFEAAARYLGMLNETGTAEVKKSVVPELLDVYLRWPKPELAAELVANCLLEGDIDPNSAIVRAIDAFLVEPPEGTDTNAVLQAMAGIEIRNPRTRPKWQVQLKRWIQRFGKSESSGKPESGW